MAAGLGLAAVGVVAFAAGCGSTAGAATGSQLSVVAGENVWGDLAAQIGGARVRVTSLLTDPNADPHLFQADAADAAAVTHARIAIENGAGYDDFLGQLLSASGAHPAVIDVQRVLKSTGTDVNPHFWYDVARVPLVAQAIERALIAADPAGRSVYEAGLRRFDASLRPTLAVVAQIRPGTPGSPWPTPSACRATCSPMPGSTSVTPPGFAAAIENGNEPSAADTQAMQSLISGHRLRLLLYNTQTTSAVTQHVRALAQQAGVPVVGVTETLPSTDPTYQAWQLRQDREMPACAGRPIVTVPAIRFTGAAAGYREHRVSARFRSRERRRGGAANASATSPSSAPSTVTCPSAAATWCAAASTATRGLPLPQPGSQAAGRRGDRAVGASATPTRRSGAVRRRAATAADAQALLGDPEVLLCDEPLSRLDMASQRAVTALIDERRREAGTPVVFVTHEVNPVLPYVDRHPVSGAAAAGRSARPARS